MLNIHRTSDDELIKGCIKQHAKSQRDLYDRYSGIMFSVCLRYLKEPEIAEEVMITGFTKVFEKVGQFKFEGSFEGWMRRIMVNESLTYIRRNKYMDLEVDIEVANREPDVNRMENMLEAQDLMKMVQALPVGYRTVFNMYAIEGYSHREIGQELGVSENTSKSQLSRARSILKQHLLETEDYFNKNIQGS